MRYVCLELNANNCIVWAESYLPVLSMADAFVIGGAFLTLTATAWGVAQIARVIFNR